MPPREWKLRIQDILDAIAKIRRYTDALTIDTLMADEKTVDAVMRNIAIIGEASNHVPAAIRTRHPEVPWDEMRGIRNRLVHECYKVDMDILWQTLRGNLPPLVPLLREVLSQEP
jgi:uncharacterized protein with HEPN domain